MNPADANVYLFGLFVVGCAVALAACVIGNRMDRREGANPEAPSFAMGLMLVVAVFALSARLLANTNVDPCSLHEKGSLGYWFGFCFW
jgi:hypothetical protein